MADSVFGDLGGGVQRGTPVPMTEDGPRNAGGHPTNNPSGDGTAPALDSVFGDLGGGVSSQLRGPEIVPGPVGTDPGGQGGR